LAKYHAEITAGSLKVSESRIIADLLIHGLDEEGWHQAIIVENKLQARSPATAIRLRNLIRKRLRLMTEELWHLIRDGSQVVATHAVLATAIKHSRLLGDFLDLVVREQFRVFSDTLPKRLFDEFIQGCHGRDPDMPDFTETTLKKLQTTIYHILVQAGYLSDTRTLKLQSVHIATPVINYLEGHGEDYVLRCIQVAP